MSTRGSRRGQNNWVTGQSDIYSRERVVGMLLINA